MLFRSAGGEERGGVGDDVGVFVFVGGEQEAEGEAAGVGVGVCVGDGGEAGGGGEAGEERSAWGCEVRCAGER